MGTCVANRSTPIRRINENDPQVLLGWTTEDSEDIDLDKMIWGCLSLGKLAGKAGRSVLMRNYENHTFSIKKGDIFWLSKENFRAGPAWGTYTTADSSNKRAAPSDIVLPSAFKDKVDPKPTFANI
ncbi:hypothetical protein LTR10_024344 [Elasticomyces elasticus]|uniref:SH3 domain-containing protein n=1 Tax=Exophiala sideris TaxID=1016849 RepID=A0ABR0JBG4_9EURO|nr:hypothetical protein LTR10_024344 [Elasticomyces elasticus]KAK5026052.1 hypothetical protein LTS07_007577 [Exophiala sideris]KAK5032307.1 hypothetical protein LTR13_007130 [Exophiala sideris]KAK5059462.1 hypothetical protein LTR69_006051 [Exophiala sideris]KAK5186625.1 hypothetical protein LTR44_000631 [Eurotiomycetes sp. CCFEE 6388]